MVFERAQATATRLIQRYGQPCLWRQTVATGPAGNPTGETNDDYPCTIVFLNHKRESLLSALSMLVGNGERTDIPSGALLGLMAPGVEFVPALKDTVFRSVDDTGEQYGIADENGIEILAPNGEGAVLYKLRLVR